MNNIKNVILGEAHIVAVFEKSAIIKLVNGRNIFVNKKFIYLADKVAKTFSVGIAEDYEYKIAAKEKTNEVLTGAQVLEILATAGITPKEKQSNFELLFA